MHTNTRVAFLVVGLGNPGKEYEKTRHNIGYMVVDALRRRFSFPDWQESDNIELVYTKGAFDKDKTHGVELIKSETFMNKSGLAVYYAAHKHTLVGEQIIVVHDDIDLPLGAIKISYGHGAGGHKGVTSIIDSIGTENFVRVRVGVVPVGSDGVIRKPTPGSAVTGHVLGPFTKKETHELPDIITRAADAVVMIISEGRQEAMNTFN